jgi:hypothetical protein
MLHKNNKMPWKTYLESYFKEPIEMIPYYNLSNNDYPHFRQPFYNELFDTWHEIYFYVPIETIQLCEQIVWKNSLIKIDNKPVSYKQWRDKGIYFLQQLLDEHGLLISKENLEKKYNMRCRGLQFEGLIHAIPNAWKKQLTNDNISSNIATNFKCNIKYKNEMREIGAINTCKLYWHLIEKQAERPTSEQKWLEKQS